MILVVEHREGFPLPRPEPGPRSTERALACMRWPFAPGETPPPARGRVVPRAAADAPREDER